MCDISNVLLDPLATNVVQTSPIWMTKWGGLTSLVSRFSSPSFFSILAYFFPASLLSLVFIPSSFSIVLSPPLQLESRVSDLTREKSDLESRVEEDTDEIEELTGKQRSLISQNTQLQTQLAESHQQIAELEDTIASLESKVC